MTRSFSLLAELAAEGRLSKGAAMQAPVLNLAATVKEAQTALAGIPGVMSRLKTAALGVAGQVDKVESLAGDLEDAGALLASVVTGATTPSGSNNPPPDTENPTPPAGSSPPSPPPSGSPSGSPTITPDPSAGTMERTAIGPVRR